VTNWSAAAGHVATVQVRMISTTSIRASGWGSDGAREVDEHGEPPESRNFSVGGLAGISWIMEIIHE
jgi:hypothetical protein